MRLILAAALLLALLWGMLGCLHAQGNLLVGLPAAGIASKHVYGFTINPDEWDCTRATTDAAGDCTTCINVSEKAAELSTGELLPNGDWDVRRQWFKPYATVWLCQPQIKRVARWF